LPAEKKRPKFPYCIERDACTGCMSCVGMGCPAIHWTPLSPEEARELGFKEKQKGYARISEELCNGCGQCTALCKFGCMTREEEK
jgi:indolepyruvate ferredoxin oxidoreductase alpha subunit